MCLAIPGKVLRIDGETARVDFGGAERTVHLHLVPFVEVGGYVLTHAGFAIQTIAREEAERTLALLDEALRLEESSDRGDEA